MAVDLRDEDGSGVPGANTYVTLEQADEYHTQNGNTAWFNGAASPSDDLRASALIRAAVILDGSYKSRWPGRRTHGRNQGLDWPRTGAADAEGFPIQGDEIPVEIRDAQCEMALREYVSPGSLNPDVVETSRVLREKVGDLEVQYADVTKTGGSIPQLTFVDNILAGILAPGSSTTKATWFLRS